MTIESYNYNDEPSDRADTLAMALDKCERLEKQLKIAVEALKEYTTFCRHPAEEALAKIKELEK